MPSLVRVILPTRNRAALLAQAVASVIAQSHSTWELVVVDDGSTDGTAETMAAYSRSDSRIRYVRQESAGAGAARNRGLDAAGSFDYVAFLDSDDVWHAHHLEASLRVLAASPARSVSVARIETIDRVGKLSAAAAANREQRLQRPFQLASSRLDSHAVLLTPEASLRGIVSSDFCPHTSTIVMRADASDGVRFDASLCTFEDIDYWVRLAAAGTSFAFIDDVHCAVRYMDEGLTANLPLSDERLSDRLESVLIVLQRIHALCRTREDRKRARGQMAQHFWLLGQSFSEQRKTIAAFKAYSAAWWSGAGWKALRSIGGLLVRLRHRRREAAPYKSPYS